MTDSWQDSYLTIGNVSLNASILLSACQQLHTTPPSGFDQCYAYIQGRDNFTMSKSPEAIACNTSPYGDVWAVDYQTMSCCSADGRYFATTGQISTFDFTYNDPSIEISPVLKKKQCNGYARALTALPCSPHQGKYIVNGAFKVCRSSCDYVYEACGNPGDTLSDAGATWTDGTSLCQAAWGHFSNSNDGTNCAFPDSPFCNVAIDIIDDVATYPHDDCLSFIRPNFDLTSDPNYDYVSNAYCAITNDPNVDANNLCADIENTMARRRRRLSTDTCGNIPMYARDSESRQFAINNGCFNNDNNNDSNNDNDNNDDNTDNNNDNDNDNNNDNDDSSNYITPILSTLASLIIFVIFY